MTTAVVTGAGGFVGRHLCARLVADGWTIKVITRGVAPAGTQLLGVTLDSSDEQLAVAFSGAQVVYHLAGLAHEGAMTGSVAELQEVNVDATVSIFKAAVLAGVPAFVWLSSIKVLGDVSVDPLRPDDTVQPGDAYAESKLAAELALARCCVGNTRLAVVRPPLVYGAGVRGNFLRMLRWSARGIPLPLAHATAPRSLVGVANLCDLLVRLSTRGSGVFHVADPEDVSVAGLLGVLATLLGKQRRLFGASPELLRFLANVSAQQAVYSRLFDPLQVDQSVTCDELDWYPPFEAGEQMEATVKWFQQQR